MTERATRIPDEPQGPAAPTAWSEGRFRALMLHSGDIISVLDAQGRLLYNSPAAERISGYRPEELAGVETFELVHPDDQALVAEVFQRVLAAPGAGTTALVRLPLAEPPAQDTRPAGQAPAAARARPGERLLLADDDDLVRSAVRRMLLRLGWEVDEVRDGLEVLERVAQAPQAYAAAILDVRMPRLGGPEAARQLARTAPGLPVLLVSGFTEGAERLEGMLPKPFTSASLGAKVRQIIDGPAGPRAPGG